MTASPKRRSGRQAKPPAPRNLKVDKRPVDELRPYAQNARTHSAKQIRQIADSIREFGFTNPVLVDAENGIIAGHGRVAAAKLLGLDRIPVIRIEDLSDDQIRAYIIADNRLAENAGWDREILALELQSLSNIDLDFDLTITGFETPEIDILIGELGDGPTEPDELDPTDEIPHIDDNAEAITRPGDLWIIGEHRLICGDATDPATFDDLLDGQWAQMVFTDPPFNVPIDGHVCGRGSVTHREFAMASGEMSETAFIDFLSGAFTNLASHSMDGAIHYVCIDWRHVGEMIAAGKAAYSELKNICVWAKTNGGLGSFYRSQHELVFVFKSGSAAHINNVQLGRYGRNRTNLWTYAGINAFGKTRDEELGMHPTVKPVTLVADAILDCSKRGGIVLDAFAGSGTTLLAAERTGRVGYGAELDPSYCDVIIRRLNKVHGLAANHARTGMTFDEVTAERTSECPETTGTNEETV